jgi:hypothetical protein
MQSVRKMVRAVPWTSEAWVTYYEGNARNLLPLPWHLGPELTDVEKNTLAASLQDFQLGETSEGHCLRQRAQAHARATNDPAYCEAIAWFIREEQRHASVLGDFLRAAEIPLSQHTWLDAAFRWLRHRAGLELLLCVLVTAEIIGKIYYRAVLRGSRSRLLRAICTQLLRDEVRHLRFQRERLALLRRQRSSWKLWLTLALQRWFYRGTCLVVWIKHRRALRTGGLCWRSYRRQCRQEWRTLAEQSQPAFYDLSAIPPVLEPSAPRAGMESLWQ